MFRALVDLVLPERCVSCSRYGTPLCESCAERFRPNRSFTCPFCPTDTVGSIPCEKHRGAALDRLIAAGYYHDPVLRAALHELKYGFTESLAGLLGSFLARSALALRTLLPEYAVVVPIPMSAARLRERGFNQALLLAQFVARALSAPLRSDWLIRAPQPVAQALLAPDARRTHMADTMAVQNLEAVRNQTILLVDDVSTTGATIEVAARVLKNAGAHTVSGLVLAKG